MKKILYVILHTCTRPERYEAVVNTWGKDVDFIFYADCDDEEKKIIKVSDDTSYSSNEAKHVNVIKYLFDNDYQYEWFFFCDDDTFVNTKKLEENLNNFDKEKIIGQKLKGTWPTDTNLEYCSGGAGYLINKNILEKIAPMITIKDTGYSDVTLGLSIIELGLKVVNQIPKLVTQIEHNEKFNGQSPTYYNIDISSIKDVFTYHYIDSQTMVEMYEILNNN
jgi:hypothetical protein